jgi:hypothetical protein
MTRGPGRAAAAGIPNLGRRGALAGAGAGALVLAVGLRTGSPRA